MLFLIHKAKPLPLFSLHPMDQQVCPSYHTLLIVTPSYHSKVTHIGILHAQKIAESVLLYVFRTAFPACQL